MSALYRSSGAGTVFDSWAIIPSGAKSKAKTKIACRFINCPRKVLKMFPNMGYGMSHLTGLEPIGAISVVFLPFHALGHAAKAPDFRRASEVNVPIDNTHF